LTKGKIAANGVIAYSAAGKDLTPEKIAQRLKKKKSDSEEPLPSYVVFLILR
jgi:hypothetical protein